VAGIGLVSTPSGGKDRNTRNHRRGAYYSRQWAKSVYIVRLYRDCGGLLWWRNVSSTPQNQIELKTNQNYTKNDQCDAVNPAKLHGSLLITS